MVSKKKKDIMNDAINRLAESSERLERTTTILVGVTVFLLIFTFVGASAGYNYPGRADNFLLALFVAIIVVIPIVYFLNKGTHRKE